MSQTLHQNLHQQLVELHGRATAWVEGERPEGFYSRSGICDNLVLDASARGFMFELMAAWPNGTGV